jgi:two-component system cell cycle sensor histidine kinase/response regulator CckA
MRRPRSRVRVGTGNGRPSSAAAPDFAALVEDVDGIVWEAEPDTQRFTFVSRGAERLLGYPTSEWLADPGFLARIVHPDDRSRILDASASSIVQVQDYRREYRAVAADGRVVWLADVVRVVTGPDGRASRLRGVMLDITDRVRAEQAHLHSEEQARIIAENIVGLLWMSDPGKRALSYVGPQYEEIWGRPREALLADPLAWLDAVHPEDRGRVRASALEKQVLGQFDETYRVVRPDGTERWVHDRAFPVKDASGKVTRIVGIAEDITDRRRAEERLRLSEERFRVVSHATSDAVYDYDAVTGRVWWSAGHRELFGQPPGSLDETAADWLERVHPADRARIRASLEAGMAGTDNRWTEEYRYRRGDGSHAEVQDRGWFLRDREGRVVRMIGAVMDVTRRKDLERELRQSQKMEAVGRLAGGVSHDFNNLLTAILGYTELLLARVPPGDPMAKELSEIERAGQRAATLTRQLLAFSRRQVLQPRVVDLNALVSGMEELLRRLVGEQVELEFSRDASAGLVRVDRGQLEQVVLNLVVNARDALPSGGVVTVATGAAPPGTTAPGAAADAPVGEWTMLEVRDGGIGMDASVQARLFEPFFTTKGPGKGTGLGLSTVYGIVRQSGGFVRVDSAPGRGSAFRVFLPRVVEGVADPAAPEAKGPVARGTETVLLVEDEQVVRTLVREILSSRGYRVLEAAGGEAAIRAAEEFDGPIHLLLTDVVMPRMSGRQLAERLLPLRPHMRVLYMSGYTDNSIVHHGVLDPGIAFLEKPVTPDKLARKVREVLDSI